MPHVLLVAAVAQNRVIGRDNQLLWHLLEDMAHFKALTQGHGVLMGRKTWESLPARFRPLPGRRNLVLSRQSAFQAPGAEVVSSLEDALTRLRPEELLFVIGGAEIYAQTLPLAERLILTEIELAPEGDAFFPEIPPGEWQESGRRTAVSAEGTRMAFVTYERRTSLAGG